jgi:nucleoid-associated protein YgaU
MASRLTAPSRLLVLLTIIAVMVVLLLASLSLAGGDAALAGDGTPAVAAVDYLVVSGDTLWGIALAHDPGGDTRATVHAIKQLNGIDGSLIHPGDVLRIPIDA